MAGSENILEVKNLYVSSGGTDIVQNGNFSLKKGEFLGIAGGSGCGKTTLLRALMMLKRKEDVIKGSVRFQGRELTAMEAEELRRLRGSEITMIPQNAAEAMDGTKTISALFYETIRMHSGRKMKRRETDRIAGALMEKMQLEDIERVLKSYPFELSGGMCQRVMIAAAMANHPGLMLCDEPTSALDVANQLKVIQELEKLKKEEGISLIMISHNLGVISRIADKIAVMYGGRIVEYGSRDQIIYHSLHPYTKALLGAVPDGEGNISEGLPGLPPAFEKDRKGCPFAPRCPVCEKKCLEEFPEDTAEDRTHRVQCFRAKEWKDAPS